MGSYEWERMNETLQAALGVFGCRPVRRPIHAIPVCPGAWFAEAARTTSLQLAPETGVGQQVLTNQRAQPPLAGGATKQFPPRKLSSGISVGAH